MSKITNLEQELYLEELLLAHPREENSGERPALLLAETWAVVLCVHMDELPELEALMAARRAFPSSKKKLAKRMALLGLYASVLSLLYVMLMLTIVFLIAFVVYVIQSI